MVLFFLSLSFAAITSLIAMVELGTRVLVDAGVEHVRAVRLVGSVGFVMGLPSAISLRVLGNQDWVWGVALLLAGLFFAIAAISHGVTRLREEDLNHQDSDIRIGRWWDIVIGFVVPVEAIVCSSGGSIRRGAGTPRAGSTRSRPPTSARLWPSSPSSSPS